jgi:hypothetical protein
MKVIIAERFKIGDTVIWRPGKSKSKTVLPIGVADCRIMDLGEGPSGEKAASIMLPKAFARRASRIMNGIDPTKPFWVLVEELE